MTVEAILRYKLTDCDNDSIELTREQVLEVIGHWKRKPSGWCESAELQFGDHYNTTFGSRKIRAYNVMQRQYPRAVVQVRAADIKRMKMLLGGAQ